MYLLIYIFLLPHFLYLLYKISHHQLLYYFDNIEDVLNKLGEISNQEEHKSSSFTNVLEGGWYDVYENKERNIWIININMIKVIQ